ncbi:hypothetical protein BDP27DRAFT_1368069 [Rhodocollybia butyracea]|uniref:Uncharacterized protein n=1 Tax=Rhodocollybia butyracea TaxID=206335 RepID=A0A9P5PJV9_9AGAR|nr:hypothetical protein BDP27DRAFT_1368069 [Rhodocollybia butyracea]
MGVEFIARLTLVLLEMPSVMPASRDRGTGSLYRSTERQPVSRFSEDEGSTTPTSNHALTASHETIRYGRRTRNSIFYEKPTHSIPEPRLRPPLLVSTSNFAKLETLQLEARELAPIESAGGAYALPSTCSLFLDA